MLLIFLSLCLARADEMEALREKLLLNSKNSQELESNLFNFKEMVVERSKCDQELKNKQIPLMCYKFIHKQELFGLISQSHADEQRSRLNRICVQNVEAGAFTNVDATILGKECQLQLKLKIEKQKYLLEEAKPEEIILGTQ